jgi:hypothetical protein
MVENRQPLVEIIAVWVENNLQETAITAIVVENRRSQSTHEGVEVEYCSLFSTWWRSEQPCLPVEVEKRSLGDCCYSGEVQ